MSREVFSPNCRSRRQEAYPSLNPHLAAPPVTLYTFRTNFPQPSFSPQPPFPHPLASKNTEKQKLNPYTFLHFPMPSAPVRRLREFHASKSRFVSPCRTLYRSQNPCCTAVFCTVPQNRIFFFPAVLPCRTFNLKLSTLNPTISQHSRNFVSAHRTLTTCATPGPCPTLQLLLRRWKF